MKLKLTLMAMVAGAVALVSTNASAFPLQLKALNGVIRATEGPYSAVSSVNKTNYVTKAFNLKTVLTLVSNTIVYIGSTNIPPANAYIVWDSYHDTVYLTNSAGYYQSLSYSGLGSSGYYVTFELEDMAASFSEGATSISENDSVVFYLYFDLVDADGLEYYAGADYGIGNLHMAANTTSANMSVSGSGADYGQYKSSYDGTSRLSFVFAGSTTGANFANEFDEPYWVWWE